jgi:hypothetical protein
VSLGTGTCFQKQVPLDHVLLLLHDERKKNNAQVKQLREKKKQANGRARKLYIEQLILSRKLQNKKFSNLIQMMKNPSFQWVTVAL